jgi:hypothetical protein
MMAPSTQQSFALTNIVANPILIPYLRSRLGRRLGQQLAVVEYSGRRSGTRHQLVTQYVRHGATVRVRIGAAERKTWWRNFLAPRAVRLHLAGQDYDATAHVVREDGRVSLVAELDRQAS